MIDLTPLDVRKKRGDFRSRLRGYDPEEVDSFLELVAERLEALVKENMNLSEEGDRQATQLTAVEEREKAIQDALVTAQRLRDDLKDQTRQEAEVVRKQAEQEAEVLRSHAKREAELLRREAEGEIDRRLGGLDSLIRERKEALAELERKRTKFLKAFRSLLERELDGIEVEEARTPLEELPLDLQLGGEVDTEEPLAIDEPLEEEEPALVEEAEEPALFHEAAESATEEAIEGPLSLGEGDGSDAPDEAVAPVEDEAVAAVEDEAVEEPEVISLAEDVSEALVATALGGMADAEPTPVEDLAPDDGAFSTQKFEPAFGSSLGEETEDLPQAETTEPSSALEEPASEGDQQPATDSLLAVPVGEMLMDDLAPTGTDEAPREAGETDVGATPDLLETEEEPGPEPQASSPGSESPQPPSDPGPSQPVWLSAILKEEHEERSESDEEDRQA